MTHEHEIETETVSKIYAGDFYEAAKADPNEPFLKLNEASPQISAITSLYFDEHYPILHISKNFGIARKTVRRMIRSAVDTLWHGSTSDTQQTYPIELFYYTKPKKPEFTFKKARHINSLTYQAAQLALEGLSAREIQSILNLPTHRIHELRVQVRKSYGIQIPKESPRRFTSSQLARMISLEIEPNRAQFLLSHVTKPYYISYLQYENPPIVKISDLLEEINSGKKRATREIVEKLEQEGIPVGKVINYFDKATKRFKLYYVISTPFIEKAKKVLEEFFVK